MFFLSFSSILVLRISARDGSRTNLSLQFWQSHSPQVDSFATPTEFSDFFYQADISGDEIILGCPFMVNNAMGPLLHCRCLVIELEDNLFYLFSRSQGAVSVLETIHPSMAPDALPDRPSPTSIVDAFVSAANHQFPRYRTEMDSTWQRSWSEEFIWDNPPFELLGQVVRKFISDNAQWILLLLIYSSTCPSKEVAYRGALAFITLKDYTFLPHTKLFLREKGKALGPTL